MVHRTRTALPQHFVLHKRFVLHAWGPRMVLLLPQMLHQLLRGCEHSSSSSISTAYLSWESSTYVDIVLLQLVCHYAPTVHAPYLHGSAAATTPCLRQPTLPLPLQCCRSPVSPSRGWREVIGSRDSSRLTSVIDVGPDIPSGRSVEGSRCDLAQRMLELRWFCTTLFAPVSITRPGVA